MHDSRGAPLKVGDRVFLEAELTSVQESDNGYCNVSVTTVTPEQMQSGADSKPPMSPSSLTLNTRMLTKVGAILLLALLLALPAMAQDDVVSGQAGLAGALPTPQAVLEAAPRFIPAGYSAPDKFAAIPKLRREWANDRYGVCVTSEEAFAKEAYAAMCDLPEPDITDAEVIRWARSHGVLHGAMLTDVMQWMQKTGLKANSVELYDGPYRRVDYTDSAMLRTALIEGPVKLGVASSGLRMAGGADGWYALRGGRGREDHCVSLCGYGPAEWLYEKLGVTCPDACKGQQGYLLFTWGSIGFVTDAWLQGFCSEAWVRVPTTVGQEPKPPEPPTPPTPPIPPTPPPAPTPWWMTLLHYLLPFLAGTGGGAGGMHLLQRRHKKR